MNTRLLTSIALLAIALGGCAADLGTTISSVNLNPFGADNALNSADYNYFYRRDQTKSGFVSAADLVGPDGRCAFDPAPAYTPGAPEGAPAPQQPEPMNPRSNQALYFTAGPETGRTGAAQAAMPPEVRTGPTGIALGMTECQVVRVAGSTDRVEISTGERGQRVVTLTYMSGYRPGIYRFSDGRLTLMDRVEAPPPPKKPQRAAKTAKTKPRQ